MTNLLQLAHFTLFARLANEVYAVDARLLAVAVGIGDEEDDRVDVLELDEAELELGCLRLLVPVRGLELNDLGCGDVFCFLEAQVVLAVDPDVDGLWSHGGFVIIVIAA